MQESEVRQGSKLSRRWANWSFGPGPWSEGLVVHPYPSCGRQVVTGFPQQSVAQQLMGGVGASPEESIRRDPSQVGFRVKDTLYRKRSFQGDGVWMVQQLPVGANLKPEQCLCAGLGMREANAVHPLRRPFALNFLAPPGHATRVKLHQAPVHNPPGICQFHPRRREHAESPSHHLTQEA